MNPIQSLEKILLEIPITSVEDVLAAEAGGADRVELNAALSLGGLTPSLGTLQEVRAASSLPIMVMIRPRPGGFYYSEHDFRVMVRDGRVALENEADGLVFGFLTEEGRVDKERCRRFMEEVGPAQFVFHRAFDVTPDALVALEELADLGFLRIMTSGQQESAYQGSALIKQLMDKSEGRIEILPAGGINRFTVADVIFRTQCKQIHCSLRSLRGDSSTAQRPHISFGGAFRPPEDRYDGTSLEAVREMEMILENRRGSK